MITAINNNRPQSNISFKSYYACNPKTHLPASSSFFGDLPTLKTAVSLIEKNFPNGTDILVYAGSNGEEAISILSLLRKPDKFNIYSIDPFKNAIEYAKDGFFSVHCFADDAFLINNKLKTDAEKKAAKGFAKYLREIEKPQFDLNNIPEEFRALERENPYFTFERFYQLKPFARTRIQFIEGDIRDIGKFKTERPVGAIFFRNALYHLTDNDLVGIFNHGYKPNTEVNRYEILRALINDVDKKLAQNGIFVLGNHAQEHFYVADKYTPKTRQENIRGIPIRLDPLLDTVLKETGHFESRYMQKVTFLNGTLERPLIWQKTNS